MPINKDLIAKKLDFLNNQIQLIERMEFDEQTFVENEDIHDLVTFRLQQGVETCIDITTHIIAESGLPRKETTKDALCLLREKGIIDQQLAQRMGQAADFRNRVVHGYNDFDFHLLFRDYTENIKDLKLFGGQILKYLESP